MASFEYSGSIGSATGPDSDNTEAVTLISLPDGLGGFVKFAVTSSRGNASPAENGVAVYQIVESMGDASFGAQTDTAVGAALGDVVDLASITIGSTAYVFSLSRADDAIQAMSVDATGQITQLGVADLASLTGNANFDPTGLDITEQNGQIYLMSTGTDGLHAIEFNPGTGIFTGTPFDSEVLGTTAANGYWGYTAGAVDPNSFVEVETIGGTRFVLTGGGDSGSGLDLFTFDASGAGLTHVSAIDALSAPGLTDVRAADIVQLNGRTFIIAGGDDSAGQDTLTVFEVSAGPSFTITQVFQTPALFDTVNDIEVLDNPTGTGLEVLIGQEGSGGLSVMWLGIDPSTGDVTLTDGVDEVTNAEAGGSMGNVSSIASLDGLVITGSDNSSQTALMTASTYIPPSANYCFVGETANGYSGRTLAGDGDFDGDGYADILIGAYGPGFANAVTTGTAYLIAAADLQQLDQADLSEDGAISLANVIGTGNSFKFSNSTAGDSLGRGLSFVDDIDGDGRDDILIGGPGVDVPGSNAGQTYLIAAQDLQAADASDGSLDGEIILDLVNFASLSGSYKFSWIDGPVATITNSNVGMDLDTVGDIDGDGKSELLISGWGIGGQPSGSNAFFRSGTVFLASSQDFGAADAADGNTDNEIDLGNLANPTISPNSYEFIAGTGGDYFGRSVSSIADVDGDGLTDFLFGAQFLDAGASSTSNEGGGFIVTAADLANADLLDPLSPTTGDGRIFVDNLVNSTTTSGSYRFIGETSGDSTGVVVASMDDFTGDGFGDLIVSAPDYDDGANTNAGAVYVISGGHLEDADIADATNDQDIELAFLTGATRVTDSYKIIGLAGERIGDFGTLDGRGIASAGDTDADGLDDLLIGGLRRAYLLSSQDRVDADAADGSVDGVILTSNIRLQDDSYEFLIGSSAATVEGAGDVDNDGLDDFLISAAGRTAGGVARSGATFLVRSSQLELLDAADGTSDNIIDLTNHIGFVCFARGTLIATDQGVRAVEDLCVGDLVTTHDHAAQPVRWIGSRKVSGQGDFAPICIRKGVLGNTGDLYVSPQHRMLVEGGLAELLFGEDEVLATAKSLLAHDKIFRAPCDEVEYFHILFDQHEIVCANGALSESYHTGEEGLTTMSKASRREILTLFPELEQSLASYGPTARRGLKHFEGQALSGCMF